MTDWKPGHEAGSALILQVVEAARAMVSAPGYGLANLLNPGAQELVTAVRMLDGAMRQLAPRPAWRAGTWEEVARFGQEGAGTRVRLGTTEAIVESAVIQEWHVDPRSNPRYPQPLEHRVVWVRLEGRESGYRMPLDGAVEILDVEYPEASLTQWMAAAGAVLEAQAMYDLKKELGAEEVEQ